MGNNVTISVEMEQVPGFVEIASTLRHYVILDISTRMQVTQTFWTTSAFVENYVNWVEALTEIHLAENATKADMWEFWGHKLKDLYLGF